MAKNYVGWGYVEAVGGMEKGVSIEWIGAFRLEAFKVVTEMGQLLEFYMNRRQ